MQIGFSVIGYDPSPAARQTVTAGDATDSVLRELSELFTRSRSRREASFADRLLAALRNAFGGHATRR